MDAVSLLRKYYSNLNAYHIVYEHSRLVSAKALGVAQALGLDVASRQFIAEASLLHDIGVCRTDAPGLHCHGHEPYMRHGVIGREILEAEGLPRHALVCERHIGVGLTIEDIRAQKLPLPERDMSPISLEERIVCYADLFYSKKPRYLEIEKTPDEVRQFLSRLSPGKVLIFDQWQREFSPSACRAAAPEI